jgi:hypothetical protein
MSIASVGKTRSLHSAPPVPFGWDLLRVTTFTLHLLIVTYVSTGWMSSTRIGLFFYLLLLPVIVMQWLLNAGGSILNNAETLIRTGRWHDARNTFEGHFFQNMLRAVDIRVSTALINVVVCMTMLFFWFEAFFRMVLIPTTP